MSFSIRHEAGKKDTVKIPYVNNFEKLVKAIKERDANDK